MEGQGQRRHPPVAWTASIADSRRESMVFRDGFKPQVNPIRHSTAGEKTQTSKEDEDYNKIWQQYSNIGRCVHRRIIKTGRNIFCVFVVTCLVSHVGGDWREETSQYLIKYRLLKSLELFLWQTYLKVFLKVTTSVFFSCPLKGFFLWWQMGTSKVDRKQPSHSLCSLEGKHYFRSE